MHKISNHPIIIIVINLILIFIYFIVKNIYCLFLHQTQCSLGHKNLRNSTITLSWNECSTKVSAKSWKPVKDWISIIGH